MSKKWSVFCEWEDDRASCLYDTKEEAIRVAKEIAGGSPGELILVLETVMCVNAKVSFEFFEEEQRG